MKRAVAFLLILCMFVSFSSALASEITEEHFPGYYVELRSKTKDLKNMAKAADWKLVEAASPTTHTVFYAVAYPSKGSASRDGFSYEGKKASFYILTNSQYINTLNRASITGNRFAIEYSQRDEFESALNESLEWLEEHFGTSPVGSGQYLLKLNNDLVEVSVYQLKNARRSVCFDMMLVEDADQALTTYGYQALDDVPVAPWTPMGIPAEE